MKSSKSNPTFLPIEKRPNYMTYGTYVAFRDFIENQKKQAHRDYCIASDYTHEWAYNGSSPPQFNRTCEVLPTKVRDFMWENYRTQIRYYNDMLEQLKHAAKMSNSLHPNPEMRKFWET